MAKDKIPTGQAAENALITRMGGTFYPKGAGSQATDIIMSHPDHGDFETEMKGGPTVDHSQMRVAVDNITGKLKQTVKSQQMSGDRTSGFFHPVTGKIRDVLGLLNRPFRGVELKPGQVTIERQSKKDPSVTKVEKRAAAMDQVKQAPVNRIKMNNKNAVSMMSMGDDHVHVAIHHKTGEVAFIPTKDKHRHLGDKLGLDKTVTYSDLAGDDHGHKNTLGMALRGARPKAGTLNASLETSSGNMVDAVRDAGGHVFKNLDHATEHLRGLGWTARSGHAMSESVGMLLQGKYHEAVALKEVVSKLVEYSGAQFQDKMVSQDLNTKKDEDKKESPSLPRLQPTGVRDLFKTIGSQAATSLLSGPEIVMPASRQKTETETEDETGKKDSEKTTQSTPPENEPVRAEPNPVTVSDEDKERSQRSSGRTVSPGAANESMFHIASALRENDENYSDDEISRDKDPNAAGGPYSEDDIKVTQDPRDAAPGMDPVADPPTLQAKQVTTGIASKAPAAAGTMQTMLPGGEHDAIQKQYPDLIEGLFGGEDEMKGFLMDPKDKKKSKAACAIMAMLDKKLKDDKKARVAKILNNNKPPAIPGSEGY